MAVPSAGFFSESFDAYNGTGGAGSGSFGMTSRWTIDNVGAGYGLVTGRFGTGQAMQWQNDARGWLPLGMTVSKFAIGTAFMTGGYPSGQNQAFLYALDGAWSEALSVGLTNGTGALMVRANGVVQGTSPYSPAPNSWHYIELVGDLGGGAADVFVDGVNELHLTGLTLPFGSATLLATGDKDNGHQVTTFDDMYFNPTNVALGPGRASISRPNGNSSVGWTPDSGSNYARVGETLIDDDSSYVSATTAGASDLYGLTGLPSTPLQVLGATVIGVARTTDANPRKIRLQVQSGATLDQGADIVIGSNTYTWNSRVLLNDPNTGAPWTPAAIASLLAGPYLSA